MDMTPPPPPDRSFPYPTLVPTAAEVVPGDDLPLRVAVTNPEPTALEGARAELTLEVEKGVLITWLLHLATVPAGGRLDDARQRVTPDWRLPSNVPHGTGRLRVLLLAADGSFLNEDRGQIRVVGTTDEPSEQPAVP